GQVDAFALCRDDRHGGAARRRERRFSRRGRSGAALYFDRGARLLLFVEQRDAQRDLRPRPARQGGEGRTSRPHGGAGAGGADRQIGCAVCPGKCAWPAFPRTSYRLIVVLRKQEPICRGLTTEDAGGTAPEQCRRWLWAPAFAGATTVWGSFAAA